MECGEFSIAAIFVSNSGQQSMEYYLNLARYAISFNLIYNNLL